MRSETVASSLQAVTRPTSNTPAYLLDAAGNTLYSFLYNPETLEYSREISHAKTETALTSTQGRQFIHADGATLTLNDLLLEAFDNTSTKSGQPAARSVQPLVEGIEALALADVPSGKFSPTEVYFSWGTQSFGPAYITGQISWRVTQVVAGHPVAARLSFTLQEIPPVLKDTINQSEFEQDYNKVLQQELAKSQDPESEEKKQEAVATASNTRAATSASTATEILLRPRQRREGEAEASAWLDSNAIKLPSYARNSFRTGEFSIEVQSNGEVYFIGETGKALASLGTYDGDNFTPKITAISTRS